MRGERPLKVRHRVRVLFRPETSPDSNRVSHVDRRADLELKRDVGVATNTHGGRNTRREDIPIVRRKEGRRQGRVYPEASHLALNNRSVRPCSKDLPIHVSHTSVVVAQRHDPFPQPYGRSPWSGGAGTVCTNDRVGEIQGIEGEKDFELRKNSRPRELEGRLVGIDEKAGAEDRLARGGFERDRGRRAGRSSVNHHLLFVFCNLTHLYALTRIVEASLAVDDIPRTGQPRVDSRKIGEVPLVPAEGLQNVFRCPVIQGDRVLAGQDLVGPKGRRGRPSCQG